jgi:hypothetical protein
LKVTSRESELRRVFSIQAVRQTETETARRNERQRQRDRERETEERESEGARKRGSLLLRKLCRFPNPQSSREERNLRWGGGGWHNARNGRNARNARKVKGGKVPRDIENGSLESLVICAAAN